MMRGKAIKKGIYLVVDPQMNKVVLLRKLSELLLNDQIIAVQVWDNFKGLENIPEFIDKICDICKPSSVPVLLNNRWELLKATKADGVHFDEIPPNYKMIKKSISEKSLVGLTCNNDLEIIEWAINNQLDYISFCSIFPSSTSNSCELVDFKVIQKARSLTQMPIFLAGGIKPENIKLLGKLDFDGVAVISGIMGAKNPTAAVQDYYSELKK